MIHHLSIPARDTRHVAEVLVELFGGTLTSFGPYRDSFIAWAGDAHGTAIEVYPLGTEMLPDHGLGQARFRAGQPASPHVATHAAVSVDRSRAEILALARREGWRAIELPRGTNHVIEFWIENAVMLELMTPDMAADYVRAMAQFRRPEVIHGRLWT
ncbi:MAG: hypothetical protein ACK5Y7_02935 [Betaproteobacteria bacterium]|jgi:hypothetical protein